MPGGSQGATPWPSLVRCAAPASNEPAPRGPEQSRDVQQILLRVVIDPSRDRICAKSQNELGDGTIDFADAGDGFDGRARLISRFIPAAKIITHRHSLFLEPGFQASGKWVRYS